MTAAATGQQLFRQDSCDLGLSWDCFGAEIVAASRGDDGGMGLLDVAAYTREKEGCSWLFQSLRSREMEDDVAVGNYESERGDEDAIFAAILHEKEKEARVNYLS